MFKIALQKLAYFFIRAITFLFSLLSYKTLYALCFSLSSFLFIILKSYRKRSLSNLALAHTLNLNNAQIKTIAKNSLAHLLITTLEYAKIEKEKNIHDLVICKNPEKAASFISQGKGVVFFCAHQANWELLFVEGTSRMPGIAIGRPVKNSFLYDWVLRVRERFGGKIIPPKNALKESLKALKKGSFVGIVGDQGMPDSGFSSVFLGRLAWTSPLPALLSYRTNSPLFFAQTIREKGKYSIVYSEPIYPDATKPLEEEIATLMSGCLSLLEKSIQEYPDQWLWQHNRWKQKLPGLVKKPFRHDSLAIILPENKQLAQKLYIELAVFREIYPNEWILLIAPITCKGLSSFAADQTLYYQNAKEMYIEHYGPKLVFNFSSEQKLKNHFLKLAAFEVFDFKDLEKLSNSSSHSHFKNFVKEALLYAQ